MQRHAQHADELKALAHVVDRASVQQALLSKALLHGVEISKKGGLGGTHNFTNAVHLQQFARDHLCIRAFICVCIVCVCVCV